MHVIEDSDDEIRETTPHDSHISKQRAHSTASSHSPRGTSSRYSSVRLKSASQARSEFQTTENTMTPRRSTNPRRKNNNRAGESRRDFEIQVPFIGAGSLSQRNSIEPIKDSAKVPQNPSSAGHHNFGQVTSHSPENYSLSKGPSERITSAHFSTKMHINESTKQVDDQLASEYPKFPTKNLREYRPIGLEVNEDPIEGSEDELAQPNPKSLKTKRKKTPVESGRTSKDVAIRNSDNTFDLSFIRTYGFESRGPQLMLRQNIDNPKVFRITGLDDEGNVKTHGILELARVNKITTDGAQNMRLSGAAVDGNLYWFDLEFLLDNQFEQFRDHHVFPEVADKARINVSR